MNRAYNCRTLADVEPNTDSSALAAAFWARYRTTGAVDTASIRQLTARAIGDDADAEAAARVLFAEVVEPLSDAFGSPEAHAYVDVFSAVLDALEHHPGGRGLARALRGPWPRTDGHHLLAPLPPAQLGDVERVVILSRVTLGADVAITTPIIAAVLEALPQAEVVLVGPEAARGLVAGTDRVTLRRADYPRRGDLRARLEGSVAVRAVVEAEVRELPAGSWALVDPDSRLSQLGLVPIAPAPQLRFFPSRTLQVPARERLGQLAGWWAQQLTGAPSPTRPQLWVPRPALAQAAALRARLAPDWPWAVVSFGVGGNVRKSLGREFEARLLRGLLSVEIGVLLARGVSPEEVAATDQLVAGLATSGIPVHHVSADAPTDTLTASSAGTLERMPRAALITWEGDTAFLAALVAAADLHVGYDSAGQHIAAAVGTPGVTAFVAAGGERHFQRWSPWGRGATHVIRVEPGATDIGAIVDRAVAAARALLRR